MTAVVARCGPCVEVPASAGPGPPDRLKPGLQPEGGADEDEPFGLGTKSPIPGVLGFCPILSGRSGESPDGSCCTVRTIRWSPGFSRSGAPDRLKPGLQHEGGGRA